ncbi:hypothetical protein [Gayadomonas joobiniege]|uniref:hypothetical protein n=1 Tax=Gayadomonas joobiniege TaxID=1234606 RepID=UPI00035C9898|nr:hypothetical protein [Gayadomonas joobiniege]
MKFFYILILSILFSRAAFANELPAQLSIDNFKFVGAFRVTDEVINGSSFSFAAGPIGVHEKGGSLFMIGHSHQAMLAELVVPELVKSSNLFDLKIAKQVKQAFVPLLSSPKLKEKNTQSLNTITGLFHLDNQLFVNAVEYYDAPADNSDTSFIIEQADNLENSAYKGFYKLEGAAHAAAWISEIPQQWQKKLGGSHITGSSSFLAINSRSSMGPSAFSFDLKQALALPEDSTIQTNAVLDYSLEHKLMDDLYNESGKNDLWNELSAAVYGFIVPGTDTYAVFGTQSGIRSKIGYKIKQKQGNVCAGPCAYDATDKYNYYWFFDVKELAKAHAGGIQPHQIKPYAWGQFKVPFQYDAFAKQDLFAPIAGAAWDKHKQVLYLVLSGAGRSSLYNRTPVIAAYRIQAD